MALVVRVSLVEGGLRAKVWAGVLSQRQVAKLRRPVRRDAGRIGAGALVCPLTADDVHPELTGL